MKTNVIKAKAIAKYGSLGALSQAMGWKQYRLSRILTQRQKLTHADMCALIKALDFADGDEIVEVFSLA